MRNTIRMLPFLLLAFGCVPHTPPWTAVGGQQQVTAGGFELDLPKGWMRLNPPDNDPLVTDDGLLIFITRDGTPLQLIRINRRPVDTDYPGTKKKLSRDLLPQELADLVFDRVKSNQNISNQRMIENSPAKISDLPGFRLLYSYQEKNGLKKKSMRYGVLANGWYYQLTYDAPARYYFMKDLSTFESLKESFRLLKASDKPATSPP